MQTADRHCWFCDSFRHSLNDKLGLPGESASFQISNDVFACPDLVPICPGHILLVSQEHYMGMRVAPVSLQNDLIRCMARIRKRYMSRLGQRVLFFEHGDLAQSSRTGCVDHLHIHCLPWSIDVRHDLARELGDFYEVDIGGCFSQSIRDDLPYLYLQDVDGSDWSISSAEIPSQFMRRWLMECKGDEFERWQILMHRENNANIFLETLEILGKVSE